MFLRSQTEHLQVRLAVSEADLAAVQRLRYDVFVAEHGATVSAADHAAQRETDHFDSFADHLLLIDPTRPADQEVVGTYRLMTRAHAANAGGFYSASEYDLTRLMARDGDLLELGRSCLDPAYRGGTALLHLWQGIGRYVADHDIDILFGVASFPGTDPAKVAQPLSLLHHQHQTPETLLVKAKGPDATSMDLIPESDLDHRKALTQMPALIKSYLRLGGTVGTGAFIDKCFNTIDVCMILDRTKMSARQQALYGGSDAG